MKPFLQTYSMNMITNVLDCFFSSTVCSLLVISKKEKINLQFKILVLWLPYCVSRHYKLYLVHLKQKQSHEGLTLKQKQTVQFNTSSLSTSPTW